MVIWAASLVHPEVLSHARPDAEVVDSAQLPLEGVRGLYQRALAEGLTVARIHSGDPALWGAVQEQRELCDELGLAHETVPGVSAYAAVAAIAGRELTIPEVAQSVILTRLGGGKTPMPPGEDLRELARHGTTMAVFLSAARSGQLQAELLAGGYPASTPVVLAYQATWPDELVVECTVGTLEQTVKARKLWKHTLFLVGPALAARGTRSRLYHPGHFHGFRRADRQARQRIAGGGPMSGPAAPPPRPGSFPSPARQTSRPVSSPARPVPRPSPARHQPARRRPSPSCGSRTCRAPPRSGRGPCAPGGRPAPARQPRPRPRSPPCVTRPGSRWSRSRCPVAAGSRSRSSPACTIRYGPPRSWSRTPATTRT